MWWLIGTMIGTVLNLSQESPEQRAKREKDGNRALIGCLVIVALLVILAIGVLIAALYEMAHGN
jgi:hypothetical protein